MKETKFKQTEVGLIPCDWNVKSVKCIAPLQRGFDLPTAMLREGNVPVVYSNGICNFHNKSKCIGPGLVTGRSGTIGKFTFIASGPYWPHNTSLWVTSFKGNNPLFVYYLYSSLKIEDFSGGSGVPTLNRNNVHEKMVAVPSSIEEQKRIAQALSDVDAVISTTEKLLAKKKALKQGTMQTLLSGKMRIQNGKWIKTTHFKQTELGPIPQDWETKPMESLIKDISDGPFGSNLKTEHYTSKQEARIVQLSNVGEDGWNDENVKYTTFSHAKDLARCIVPYGAIIIAKMMPAGRSIICPDDEKMYILGSDCVKFIPNDSLNSKYFIYFSKCDFYLKQIADNTQGSTRARTSVSKLKKIQVLLPSKPEQIAIATVLSDMDSEIAALETKLAKYRQLKTGMMQQLLTGKIRLV